METSENWRFDITSQDITLGSKLMIGETGMQNGRPKCYYRYITFFKHSIFYAIHESSLLCIQERESWDFNIPKQIFKKHNPVIECDPASMTSEELDKDLELLSTRYLDGQCQDCNPIDIRDIIRINRINDKS